MLPSGLTADLVSASIRTAFQKLHPPTRTVARLLVGSCSCDLVRPRLEDRIADERELRTRYRQAHLARAEVIRELERHRRGSPPRPESAIKGPESLASFVMEHARNAGPTVYLLDFGPADSGCSIEDSMAPLVSISASKVRSAEGEWLTEGRPTLVT